MLTSICGINWGDEGKGRMVDLLSEKFDVVSIENGIIFKTQILRDCVNALLIVRLRNQALRQQHLFGFNIVHGAGIQFFVKQMEDMPFAQKTIFRNIRYVNVFVHIRIDVLQYIF